MTTVSSEWVTPGCRASVNNGGRDARVEHVWLMSSPQSLTEGVVSALSTCTPEGRYCQDIECRGERSASGIQRARLILPVSHLVIADVCVGASGRRLDTVVRVV